jgi:hypothetical protein
LQQLFVARNDKPRQVQSVPRAKPIAVRLRAVRDFTFIKREQFDSSALADLGQVFVAVSHVRRLSMQPEDWAKKYAAMDKRIELKYQQLAKGEQIGKRPEAPKPQAKKS